MIHVHIHVHGEIVRRRSMPGQTHKRNSTTSTKDWSYQKARSLLSTILGNKVDCGRLVIPSIDVHT